jgi:two-component system, cell cycle response regulator DivK
MTEIRDDERQTHSTTPQHRPAARRPQTSGRHVILLVEDTEADRDMYGGLLWYNGYDVVPAEDGPTAIERALDIDPDLIVMDIMLGGEMDGLDVARTLRERGLRTPIIALSAHSSDEFGDRVAAAGLDAFLNKDVGPFAVVKEAMRRIGHPRSTDPGE